MIKDYRVEIILTLIIILLLLTTGIALADPIIKNINYDKTSGIFSITVDKNNDNNILGITGSFIDNPSDTSQSMLGITIASKTQVQSNETSWTVQYKAIDTWNIGRYFRLNYDTATTTVNLTYNTFPGSNYVKTGGLTFINPTVDVINGIMTFQVNNTLDVGKDLYVDYSFDGTNYTDWAEYTLYKNDTKLDLWADDTENGLVGYDFSNVKKIRFWQENGFLQIANPVIGQDYGVYDNTNNTYTVGTLVYNSNGKTNILAELGKVKNQLIKTANDNGPILISLLSIFTGIPLAIIN